MSEVLEAPGHIELQDVIISNRVEDRQIRIVAARSEIFIDSLRVTITERADDVVGETVSHSGINALKVAAAFHEIRVQQIDIGGILFDMLPICPSFPGIFL